MVSKKIAIIVGTRPEVIKMAPVYKAIDASDSLEAILISTAQHRHLSDQMLSVFDMKAAIDLDLMQPNQSLAEISAKVLTGIRASLAELTPDAVLVQGDTTTCFFSALAAFYERISVGHVEAGLRTYDFDAPWPEEMNRRLADPISRWCFAPTDRAADNLRAEGITADRIFVTGNTVIDALLMACEMNRRNAPTISDLPAELLCDSRRMILVTGHRRESFGPKFEDVCTALRQIADSYPDVIIVYPVHPNPNVLDAARRILGSQERIYLIDPVEYLSFVYLMDKAYLIISDSGGVQEEAPSLGKPVLVTREVTERPEAIESGCARLVGTGCDSIILAASLLLDDSAEYAKMSQVSNPFGRGDAAERTVQILSSQLCGGL